MTVSCKHNTQLSRLGTDADAESAWEDEHVISGVLTSVVAGTNVTVDNTDPANPIISATGGGGVTDHTLLKNIGTTTHAQIDAHISDTNNPHATTALQSGADFLHGIESAGTPTWAANVFTLPTSGGAVTYWYKGTKFTTASNITLALTPTTNVNTFVYFDSASGVLTSSTTPWSLTEHVPVATVFYNGSVAAVVIELHGYRRDLDWHKWAHNSVGTRYQSGLALSGIGGSGTGVTWTFASGTILDEDITHNLTQQTQAGGARKWRPTSATTVTFDDTGGYPFFWSGTNAQYVNAGYTLANFASNQYINVFCYAIGDTSRSIYFFTPAIAAVYTSVANARAVAPPDLSAYGMNPEMKLLYRMVISGGTSPAIQALTAADDYRTSSTVPSGGTSTPSAASVTYTPTAPDTATNVQSALDVRVVNPMTTAGDIIVGGTAGAPSRLAMGSALQGLRVNAAGTGLEYAEVSGGLIDYASGTIAITGATTATVGRYHIVSGTTADYTITMPSAASNANKGMHFKIASSGATKLYTINGKVYWSGESVVLLSDGSSWIIIEERLIPMSATLHGAGQNITVNTNTKICQTSNWSTGNAASLMVDATTNFTVTAKRAGAFMLTVTARWNNTNASATELYLRPYKNNAEWAPQGFFNATASKYVYMNLSDKQDFSAGDYFDVRALYLTGASGGLLYDNNFGLTEIV